MREGRGLRLKKGGWEKPENRNCPSSRELLSLKGQGTKTFWA
jgi:hypothetical protein